MVPGPKEVEDDATHKRLIPTPVCAVFGAVIYTAPAQAEPSSGGPLDLGRRGRKRRAGGETDPLEYEWLRPQPLGQGRGGEVALSVVHVP
jgi:hypothetical protein